MKIRGKIFLTVMTTTILLFVIVVFYLGWNFRKNSIEEAYKLADSFAKQSALSTKAIIDSDISTVSAVAKVLTHKITTDKNTSSHSYTQIQDIILNSNDKFLSVWVSWELSAINPKWLKNYGRQRVLVLKNLKGENNIIIDSTDLEGDNISGTYYKIKISKETDFITNPYYYKYKTQQIKDSILETSIVSKIFDSGKFAGILGVDLALPELQHITKTKLPFKGSTIFLISNNASFITHPDKENIGKPITIIFDQKYSDLQIEENIRQGKAISFNNIDENGNIYAYTSISPIMPVNTSSAWAVGITISYETITKKAEDNFIKVMLAGIIGMIILTIIIFAISADISKPLRESTVALRELEKGNLNLKYNVIENRSDEPAEMSKSIQKLIISLKNTADFATKIGKGELNADYKKISEDDILGNALLEMRNNLQKAEEFRKERLLENEKISWAQKGISEFGEILQKNIDRPDILSEELNKKLIKYLGAAQGGLFIINSEANILELKSAYAFDKRKKLKTEFEIGEALVGRCAKEQRTIHITDLPEGYTFISSGLGEDKPGELLLVPLMYETKITGVIELASFKKFEQYHIDFVESLSQRIATTYNNLRISVESNVLTKQYNELEQKLEKIEKKNKNLQNDVQYYQDQSQTIQTKFAYYLNAFDSSVIVIKYNLEGEITEINKSAEAILGRKENIVGKTQSEIFPLLKENIKWYSLFWDDLKNGRQRKKESQIRKKGKTFWLAETYSPIYDEQSKIYEILCIAIDITREKEQEKLNDK